MNRVFHGGVGAGSSREAQITEARALIDQADSVIPTMVVLGARASASRHQRWLERRSRLLRAWLVGAEHAAHCYGQHERGSPQGCSPHFSLPKLGRPKPHPKKQKKSTVKPYLKKQRRLSV
jgi:hypothetical protein